MLLSLVSHGILKENKSQHISEFLIQEFQKNDVKTLHHCIVMKCGQHAVYVFYVFLLLVISDSKIVPTDALMHCV